MRKLFSLILVTLVVLSGVVLNSNKSSLNASNLNDWRFANIRVASSKVEITNKESFFFHVQILNDTNRVLDLDFGDDCDVGYRLRDRDKKVIRNFDCENYAGERIILGPGEYESIDFQVKDLGFGIYRADVKVGPFSNKYRLDFEVVSPVEYISFEGGVCGGIQQFQCATGLVCTLKTNPMSAEGVCMLPDQAIPNRSERNDVVLVDGHLGLIDNDFPNFGYVSDIEFINLMKRYSNREVLVRSKDGYISRATALTAMYRTMIRNQHPKALEVNYFLDSKWSKYGNYIEESADLGLIDVTEDKLFVPEGRLTWSQADEWLRRFSR